jgi:hypothetical protein
MRKVGVTGLGLVASGKRNIRAGYEFEGLYNTRGLVGTNPIIGGELSNTYDTLNHMANIVSSTLVDTEKVAGKLESGSLEQTLRNIWNHVYNHFQYEKDATGIEQVRRPGRSWKDRKRGIDCDCMSVVISSLLHNLKTPISHAFRKAAYNEATGWQHVYVVVPKKGTSLAELSGSRHVDRSKYYVLDCVVDKFDYEVPYLKKFDKVMKIQYLNGLDAATINGGVTANLSASLNNGSSDELFSGLGCEFDILDGLSGIEGISSEALQNSFLQALKRHLINTRAVLVINPQLTAGLYNPTDFAQRLDALITAFDDTNARNQVLSKLIALEEKENGLGSANGLGSFLKKIGSGIKKAAKAIGKGAKKVGEAVVKGVKAVGKFIVKYNPLTIAIRAGMLLAMKINLFRQAEKLGYGLWDETKATEKGLDMGQFKKARETTNKVINIYKKLGGQESKIKSAIKSGWEKGVKKHNLLSGAPFQTALKRNPALRNQLAKKAASKKPSPTPAEKAQLTVQQNRLKAVSPLLNNVNRILSTVDFKTVTRKTETNSLADFLQAVRTNKGGIATKLSLAYKPSAEAKNYNPTEYGKLLKTTRSIEALVTRGGGNPKQLFDAIEAGKKVAITKETLGEPVTVASTSAASGVLATIASFLKKVDFTKMFKGKAESPHFAESEMKKFDVEEPIDDDTFDEGDPNNAAEPIEKILSDYTETDAIVEKLTTTPSSNTFKNMLPAKAKEVVANLSSSDAVKLYNQIKSSPVAQQIVNTPLAQELIKKVQSNLPAGQQTQNKYFNQEETDNQESEGKQPEGKSNTVKYVAIAAGSLAGIWLISKAFKPAQAPVADAPLTAAPAAPLSGVKSKTKRKSQRTSKKVMAITI